jgi:hypothetical protein
MPFLVLKEGEKEEELCCSGRSIYNKQVEDVWYPHFSQLLLCQIIKPDLYDSLHLLHLGQGLHVLDLRARTALILPSSQSTSCAGEDGV